MLSADASEGLARAGFLPEALFLIVRLHTEANRGTVQYRQQLSSLKVPGMAASPQHHHSTSSAACRQTQPQEN